VKEMIISILKDFIYRIRGEVPTKKLIKMGLRVGENFNRQAGCIIDYSHCWLISIGNNVTLAPRVHILAHDASTKMHLNYTKIGRVQIGDNVFVGAGTIILPNVKIGNNVIIAAGSVVTKNIPDNSVAAGNPARVISTIEDYLLKHKLLMNKRPVYDKDWTLRGNITSYKKLKMNEDLVDGIGYIE
jgi:maltose O-acetyltransferase